MANVVIDQWNKMYKLMSQYKFIISGDISDNYKCGICKNILINAYQSICGCNFCYECINQYMANGSTNCPNNTEECTLESLSNIAPNHIKNKLISKLIVRCSNKMCSHECQLLDMENHLNSCSNKAVKCPFIDVGCEHDDTINDKLNDHMLSDIHNHNKILIDLIGNLRNEMRELKEKVEGNRLEIEILKENDRVKNEIIKSLKEEIKSIKQKNEDLKQKMEIRDRNLWYKFDEIDIEMKNKCKKEELLKEFDDKFNMEMNARYCDMREELNEKFDEKIEKIKKMIEENEKLDIERSKKTDKYLNMRDYDMKEELNEKFDEKIEKIKQMIEENEKLDIERSKKTDKYLNMRDYDMKEEWNKKFNEKVEKMRVENKKLDIERSKKTDKYLNMRDYDMKEELNEKFDEKIEKIKKMIEENEKLDIERSKKTDKYLNMRDYDMKEEWNKKFNEKVEKMRVENKKLDIERSNKLDYIDKYLNMRDCGILDWQIGKINEIKCVNSEWFYDKQNPYKMLVQLQYINNVLNIYLFINSGAFDTDLKWPCRADVTIIIFAFNDLKISTKVTKSIKIDRPKINSFKFSDPIKFSYKELANSNLFNINCLLNCFVEFN